jgi:hypothetical protein
VDRAADLRDEDELGRKRCVGRGNSDSSSDVADSSLRQIRRKPTGVSRGPYEGKHNGSGPDVSLSSSQDEEYS